MATTITRTKIAHRAEVNDDGELVIYQFEADGGGGEKIILQAGPEKTKEQVAELVEHFNQFEFVLRTTSLI